MKCEILYDDNLIMVVHKPAGLAVETKRISEPDLMTEVRKYLKSKGRSSYVAVINRLDQPVEGIVLLALTEDMAGKLSLEMTQKKMTKIYEALVFGSAEEKGDLTDFIWHKKDNTSEVIDDQASPLAKKEAKKAHLTYEKLSERTVGDKAVSHVRVHLDTGRHHQIRVQLAHVGLPLLGDLKYGSEESILLSKELGIRYVRLVACSLDFWHPEKNEQMHFEVPVNFDSTPAQG